MPSVQVISGGHKYHSGFWFSQVAAHNSSRSPGNGEPSGPVAQAPAPEICGTPEDRPILAFDEISACEELCETSEDDWWVCPTEEFDDAVCYQLEPYSDGKYYADETTENKFIHLFKRCPDPASPDGYGEPTAATPIPGPLAGSTQSDIPGEYRIVIPDWSVSFTLTSQYTQFAIYVDKEICGASTWTRAVVYTDLNTGAPTTQTWGGCRSPLNLGPGGFYGDLYRRRPGTTGSGLIDFDFVRRLLVP